MDIKTIWIDMDHTLIDFNNGKPLEIALECMRDPAYYSTLKPFEGAVDILGDLSDKYQLAVISGIPDRERCGQYLNEMTDEEYMDYYNRVRIYKEDTLNMYFGKRFFDCVEFIPGSMNKGALVYAKWCRENKDKFSKQLLIDDQLGYCRTWRELGGKAIQVTKNNSLSVVGKDILGGKYKL